MNEEQIWVHVMTEVDLTPIDTFFKNWRDKQMERYGNDLKEIFGKLYELRGMYSDLKQMAPGTAQYESEEAQINEKRDAMNSLLYGEYVKELTMPTIMDKQKETKWKKAKKGRLEHILKYYDAGTREKNDENNAELNAAMRSLDNDLWEQWFDRRDNAIIKILDITGKFDSTAELKLNDKGELNGTVTGKKGKAIVKTVTVTGNAKRPGYHRLIISKA